FFQAEDVIRDATVTGVQTCALPIFCVDKDEAKVRMLEDGRMPIYEPGLEELVRRNDREERLTFTTDLASAVRASQIVIIAVGTRSEERRGGRGGGTAG